MHQLVVSERTSFNTNNNGSSCRLSSLNVGMYVGWPISGSDNLFNVVCCGGPHGALLLEVFLTPFTFPSITQEYLSPYLAETQFHHQCRVANCYQWRENKTCLYINVAAMGCG